MKILIIIGSFSLGGAERMSINTGEELTRRGHDVYYMVQRPIFELSHSIPVEKIFVLRKKNCSGFFYKMNALFLGAFSTCQKIKPDVVVGFSRFSSFLAAFTFHKNIVARLDAYPYRMNLKQKIWADVILNSPSVKKVVVPSTDMVIALKKKRPSSTEKFYLIPNSVNSLEILKKSNNEVEKFDFMYIVAMGRLSPQKNFELLIKAYSESNVKKHLKLVIIGGGSYKAVLEALVSQLDLESQVIFTGSMNNPFPIIKNAQFFVNPSNFESFGNVILEALLLSKPVIATDCSYGPSDMIKKGVNGILVKSNDVDEMTKSLNVLGGNEELRRRFEGNAKDIAMEFNIKNIGDQWETLLKEIIQNEY